MGILAQVFRRLPSLAYVVGLGPTGPRGPPGLPFEPVTHVQMEVRIMRSQKEREPGCLKPGSHEEASQSLGTQPPLTPCPTSSGFGCLHGTSTTPDGLDICGSDAAGSGRGARQVSGSGSGSAARQEDVGDLTRTVSWTDRTGMRVEINVLPAWDAGPRRRWVRQMLVDALRGYDNDDGGCPGVREPASSSPDVGSGGSAIVAPYGEAEPATALLMV